MPDPNWFPAACCPPSPSLGSQRPTVSDDPKLASIRGPLQHRCDPSGAFVTDGCAPAGQAEIAVATRWSRRVPHAPTRKLTLTQPFALHETSGRNSDAGRSFGSHVRSLRRARGMTQELLAERSQLSADTIRRLEHGSFSPSLETLRKLCMGLDLMLSTLFESFDVGDRNHARELLDLLSGRSPRELMLAMRVLRALFEEPKSNQAA